MSDLADELRAAIAADAETDDCICDGVLGDLAAAFRGEVRKCPVHDREQRDPMSAQDKADTLRRGLISSPGASTEEIAGVLGMTPTGAGHNDHPPA